MKKGFGRFGKICGIYSPIGSSTRLGEADCRRVCLPAQKSYKSEQIEQIDTMKKKDLEDLERFVEFIRLSAHQLVSARPTHILSIYKMKNVKC